KDTGLGVLIDFKASKMASFVGKLIQVRVVEAQSGHTVGLYRNPHIPSADFQGFIPGVVEDNENYDIDVYIDANANGTYDNPKSVTANPDLGWRFTDQAHRPAAGTGGTGGAGGGGGSGGAGGAGGSGGAGGTNGAGGIGGGGGAGPPDGGAALIALKLE